MHSVVDLDAVLVLIDTGVKIYKGVSQLTPPDELRLKHNSV